MNLLDSISGRFEIKNFPDGPRALADDPPPATLAEPTEPCACGCRRWWTPAGLASWRCESCQPPPSRSLVARWIDCTPRMVSEILATFCRPWCGNCGGWQGIEREFSDGSTELTCRTCQASLPETPSVAAKSEDEQTK